MNSNKTLAKLLEEEPTAYFPIYARITGSVTAGVLLSRCLFWHHTYDRKEYCKTDSEFGQELTIGLYKLTAAKKKLQELGLISIRRAGIPAKSYYTFHEEALLILIVKHGTEITVKNKVNSLGGSYGLSF